MIGQNSEKEETLIVKHGVDTASVYELFQMIATYLNQPTVIEVAKGLNAEQNPPQDC